MKAAIKYLWTLLIIPAFVLVRGDISAASEKVVKKVKPTSQVSRAIKTTTKPPRTVVFEVGINPVAKVEGFSAEGMMVQLYDENYNLLINSMVINGKVRFKLPPKYLSPQVLKLVAPRSADELKVTSLLDDNILTIHEEPLKEKRMK